MDNRNLDKVKAFEKLTAEGVGFNQACRMAGISKYTGWLIKNGFYSKRIPHSKVLRQDREGYFNVHETEWI